MDVYAANEEPIPGADGRALAGAIRMRGKVNPIFISSQEDVISVLGDIIEEGDVVLTLGAGNVGIIATEIPQRLGAPV